MRRFSRVIAAAFLFGALLPSAATACRFPPEPHELKDHKADAIVLTTIKEVRPKASQWSKWVATASVDALLWGKAGEREIEFADEGPGSCQMTGKPRPGKYYVLYLRKHDRGTYVQAMPFWWAWRSGDPRLVKLRKLFPLGNVREPTAEEAAMLDLAEPRVKLSDGSSGLERHTRIYARSSAGWVRAMFFRSRTPRRLMLDYGEERPTRQSCRCALHEQTLDLYDLEKAGKLPAFRPGD